MLTNAVSHSTLAQFPRLLPKSVLQQMTFTILSTSTGISKSVSYYLNRQKTQVLALSQSFCSVHQKRRFTHRSSQLVTVQYRLIKRCCCWFRLRNGYLGCCCCFHFSRLLKMKPWWVISWWQDLQLLTFVLLITHNSNHTTWCSMMIESQEFFVVMTNTSRLNRREKFLQDVWLLSCP